MGKKGQQGDKPGNSQKLSCPPHEPTHDKVINSISGGSEICGLTYSTAKRFAREGSKVVPKQHMDAEEKKLQSMTISSNNEAEYGALVAGMIFAYDLKANNLHVFTVSLSIVSQVKVEYAANDSKMASYLDLVKEKA